MRALEHEELSNIVGGEWWTAAVCGVSLGLAITSMGANAGADVLAVASCAEWFNQ